MSIRAALPDLKINIHEIIGGDKVASWVSWEVIHKGKIMVISPSGKRLNVSEMHFFRLENGKIVERWMEWNMFGMMKQIGLIPAAPSKA